MANGPMGGFMPTPAAPAQPPQVKLDTTADSRGNFNNFLKGMNGVNPPPVAPSMGVTSPLLTPALSNIDIFNQPVQMMQFGGSAMSGGAFSDAEIGEAIDSFSGSGTGNDSDDNIDDSPPDSDIDYTDVFTPDELQQATDIGRVTSMFADEPSMPLGQNLGSRLPTINFNQKAIQDALNQFPDANTYAKGDVESALQDFAKNNDIVGALDYFQKDSLDGDKMGLGEKVVNSIIQASNVSPSAFSAAAFNQIMPNEADKILNLGKGADELLRENEITQNFRNRDYQLPTNISLNELIAATTPGTSLYNITKSGDDKELFRGGTEPNPLKDRILQSQPGSDMRGGRRDPFDSGLRGSLTPGTSQDVIDTAKNAIRASAGNNQAIDNLVAQFGNLDPSIARLADGIKSGVGEVGEIRPGDVEDLSGTPTTLPPPEFVFDYMPGSLGGPKVTIPEIANVPEIDSSGIPYTLDPGSLNLGKTPFVADPDAFDDGAMRGLTKELTSYEPPPIVAPGIGAPKEFDASPGRLQAEFGPRVASLASGLDQQKVTDIADLTNREGTLARLGLPGFLASRGDYLEKLTRDRMAEAIARGKTDPFFGKGINIADKNIIRDGDGRVIGIRDNRGNVVEGMDPNAPIGGGDDDPIIRKPIFPVVKEEAKATDSVPNIIGGVTPGTEVATVESGLPTVVASPFAPAASSIKPVTFDSGDLNKLIEMLTGVAAKPIVSAKEGGVIGMANGGLIKAVDDFLATGQ